MSIELFWNSNICLSRELSRRVQLGEPPIFCGDAASDRGNKFQRERANMRHTKVQANKADGKGPVSTADYRNGRRRGSAPTIL
jgi:hypothetical protein